ncbi:hypothetical protein FXF51_07835 [Nonomuraea sp. PA05]|uniref:hypothetical protein n=1 Tax=Nonomuraea sp. PA05 TaxID=2604466 RepID=UPI0011D49156|nr:hypothetical protein [Nonomuraea sp. PA05]TYB69145.1 hypothetical protein FXF51_07835 [Nonomuraea sp. PA05]
MSSRIALPGLCALALLVPLVPAAVLPGAANAATCVAVTAFLVVPVVVLRRRRWAPRLGAALLALLAVAAATPSLTGLGAPSPEELQVALTLQHARGGPADSAALLSSEALSGLPWSGEFLLLLALACLAGAGLLLALHRLLHHQARELLPLRWRWPLAMWSAALVLVSVPYAMLVGILASGPSEMGMSFIDGVCFGNSGELMFATAVLALLPDPIVVAVGFGLWALLAGTGHRPAARVAGWLTVVPLVAGDLMVSWLPVLGCGLSSDEVTSPVTSAWVLYVLLPIVLILLAVRLRRAPR